MEKISNGVGAETAIPHVTYPYSTPHWSVVDCETVDTNYRVYLDTDSNGVWRRDLYTLQQKQAPTGYEIISVTITAAVSGSGYSKISILTNGASFYGPDVGQYAPTGWIIPGIPPYQYIDYTWSINPNTGVAWTHSDIINLQIGISLLTTNWTASADCYQVFSTIKYAGVTTPASYDNETTPVDITEPYTYGFSYSFNYGPMPVLFWSTASGIPLNKEIHYRVKCVDEAISVTNYGEDQVLRSLPRITTLPATDIARCTALLHGLVEGVSGELANFQYGQTTSYGSESIGTGEIDGLEYVDQLEVGSLISGIGYNFRAKLVLAYPWINPYIVGANATFSTITPWMDEIAAVGACDFPSLAIASTDKVVVTYEGEGFVLSPESYVDGEVFICSNTSWIAQTFTPEDDLEVQMLSFLVSHNESADWVETSAMYEIYATDVNHDPAGTPIWSASDYIYVSDKYPLSGGHGVWPNPTFVLPKGIEYILIVKYVSDYNIYFHYGDGTYTGGMMRYTTDSGATWISLPNSDMWFSIGTWGTYTSIVYTSKETGGSWSVPEAIYREYNSQYDSSISVDSSDGEQVAFGNTLGKMLISTRSVGGIWNSSIIPDEGTTNGWYPSLLGSNYGSQNLPSPMVIMFTFTGSWGFFFYTNGSLGGYAWII
jgi:hypothetical protein